MNGNGQDKEQPKDQQLVVNAGTADLKDGGTVVTLNFGGASVEHLAMAPSFARMVALALIERAAIAEKKLRPNARAGVCSSCEAGDHGETVLWANAAQTVCRNCVPLGMPQ